ncbi:MAG TPA: hypothetical protein VMV10_22415 [Pirellulales bacterium]|nr:hypothetical protein [Pirellulales bacterium]
MKRFILAAALLGTLTFAVAPAAQAQPYFYLRRVARAAARLAFPPFARPYYGPRYYGPRYYGPGRYWGPGYGYGYRNYGYGPGAYVGFGIY